MSGIAQRFCGSAADWPGIYPQNHEIADPDRVHPGNVVRFTCQDLAASQDPSSPARPDPGPAEGTR